LEYYVSVRRYREHKQSSGIRTGFFEKSHLVGGLSNGWWDTEFDEAWQEDLEWYGELWLHSLRRYSPLSWTIELCINSITLFGPYHDVIITKIL
jgi:hypothetical protein